MKTATLYNSTNLKAPPASFRDALLKGLAPDGGLYMPDRLPVFSRRKLSEFSSLSYPEMAAEIISAITGDETGTDELRKICSSIYTFGIPLEHVQDKHYIMRLDQGPTASFKDFAALLMGRLMQFFLKKENRNITILTATSGDTGSAVANAFHGLDSINVIILYPANEVSELQRKQMTTLGGNVSVIEIDGKFDDCQRLVKTAFMDPSLTKFNLSSANSINIGRLLPQSVYYFYAWSRLAENTENTCIFSVPSGNFGNLAGGILAARMGLPVERFVIATNENNEVPLFMQSEEYHPITPSINCISSAMNVGHPSNLARIIAMYGGRMDEKGIIHTMPDMNAMRRDFYATFFSDNETRKTIRDFYSKYGMVLEPHGAVAWAGLQEAIANNPAYQEKLCIAVETAHPAKFRDEIKSILNIEPELPEALRKAESEREEFLSLDNDYDALRRFIIQKY
ncbi:MAG TPA: threonine synthase [Bacteroidales bacterium]|nr:threonine synthase [Bacteroidales bacterium]MDI9552577.1 threonine synthase [Bacteroidota bacterium]MBP7037813.1 threonine synthase [Bacteroidales bacterium]MZP65112.1 threonine synthase [Bacteroidales bacterium]NLK53288.1 threonine synthase [Bacteroidales bacterium]